MSKKFPKATNSYSKIWKIAKKCVVNGLLTVPVNTIICIYIYITAPWDNIFIMSRHSIDQTMCSCFIFCMQPYKDRDQLQNKPHHAVKQDRTTHSLCILKLLGIISCFLVFSSQYFVTGRFCLFFSSSTATFLERVLIICTTMHDLCPFTMYCHHQDYFVIEFF